MAKSKEDMILILDGDEVIELIGIEKENFLADREKTQKELQGLKKELEAQKQLKISGYKKLGLTEEEINAIL